MHAGSRTKSARGKSPALLAAQLALLIAILPGCSLLPSDMAPTLPIVSVMPQPTETTLAASPILISEIMSANQASLTTADQLSPDWIEIRNSGNAPLNLKDYCLSDNVRKPAAWRFPSVTLGIGEYLVVYASGLEVSAAAAKAGEIHANFRLDSAGEELVLSDPAGQVLAHLVVPALPVDISYGLLDTATDASAAYFYFGEPTPGRANGLNGKQTAAAAIPQPTHDLVVNEYMTDNRSHPDLDGDLPDWVEFLNTGAIPVNLQGHTLSDDLSRPDKWQLPAVTLQPGACLLVWLSGKDKAFDPQNPLSLHAAFRLGSQDSELVLSDARGQIVIRQPIADLPRDVSYGRKVGDKDQWFYFPEATPGEANSTAGFAEISGAVSLRLRGVWINEVLAVSSRFSGSTKVSEPDWVEICNGTDQPVSLNGYGLSDDPANLYRMPLPDKTIGPGQYLLLELDGFGISADSETLFLTDSRQKVLDTFTTGSLRNGCSSGRGNSGGAEPADSRFFYLVPTPGQANSTPAYLGVTAKPCIQAVLAVNGQPAPGLYPGETVLVSLSCAQGGATIRYTLDGSEPDSQSAVYREPIRLSGSQVLRSRAQAEGYLPSATAAQTFLFEYRHDLPVFSIAIDPADFTGSQGLWTQFELSLEKVCQATFYETDGTAGVTFAAGLALHGAYGRKEIMKSLEINLREAYGDYQVIYPFFPDNEVSAFKRLILRTSGQDWKYSKLRDAFMSEVIEDDLETDTMDWRPCVLYVNGAYYGLYEVREDIDEYYMAAHFGVDPDKVDIIKGNSRTLHGTFAAYKDLMAYVKANDLRQKVPYEYVLSKIDEQSLMDWVIAQTFFNNLDSGNKKFWCENSPTGQWRWAFFDLDWAMFPSTYQKNILKYDLLDPAGHGQQNIFNSSLQVKLMQNPAFEKAFIERYAHLINTTFQTERMLTILDQMTETIRSEMPRQIARWKLPSSVAVWQRNVDTLRRITSEKRARMQVILQETFNLSAARMKELFPGEYP